MLFATKVLIKRRQTPRKTTKSCTARTRGYNCFSICQVEGICPWLQFSKPTFTRTRRTGKVYSEQNSCTMKYISQNEAKRSIKKTDNTSSGAKTNYRVAFELASVSIRTDTEEYGAVLTKNGSSSPVNWYTWQITGLDKESVIKKPFILTLKISKSLVLLLNALTKTRTNQELRTFFNSWNNVIFAKFSLSKIAKFSFMV